MTVWLQLNVALTRVDGNPLPAARALFAALVGPIDAARATGAVDLFFFQRKSPDVRLRFGGNAVTPGDLVAITGALDALAAAGTVDRWFASPYEPETRKFGGPGVADAVHRHFDADTSLWLGTAGLTTPPPLLLATAAADDLFVRVLQDRDEVWDTWANLADIASPPDPTAVAALTGSFSTAVAGLAGPAVSRRPGPLRALAARASDGNGNGNGDATGTAATDAATGIRLVAAADAIDALAAAFAVELEAGRLRVGPRAILPFVAQLDFQRWGLGGPLQGAAAAVMMAAWDPTAGLRGA